MLQVIFIYDGSNTPILCSGTETMQDICLKFSLKIQKDLKDLIFLYGGEYINFNLTYEQICTKIDKEENKMNILVYNKNSTIIKNNNSIKNSKDIICPKCEEICRIKFDNYKIKLFDCKYNHENYLPINEFDKSQKIDESKIKCNQCNKKKSESFNNSFYVCGKCNIYICPLCSSIHNKEHKLIEYDNKNYICLKHFEQFISHCENYKNNLCLQCELEHVDKHKIISYKSIYPNLQDITNKIKEMEKMVNLFNNDINNIINILSELKYNINQFYEINENIFKSFEINKRNYEILKNINEINNNIIYNDLNNIINEGNYINKFIKIYNLFSKIDNNERNIETGYNNKILLKNNINEDKNLKNNYLESNFYYKSLTMDSYASFALDNAFCVFNSFQNLLYLVYSTQTKSIMFFDIIANKMIKELKNSHKEYITNFRHYFDKISNIDYILSISCKDRNIKLWCININYECLLDIYAFNGGKIDSITFLNDDNKNYFLVGNSYLKNQKDNSENIKIFNFNGDEIKQISDSNEFVYFIDSYYDNNLFKNFIIVGNKGYLKSYDFNNIKLYHKYFDIDNNNQRGHFSAAINKCRDIIKLIDSSFDGFIRIWNFH